MKRSRTRILLYSLLPLALTLLLLGGGACLGYYWRSTELEPPTDQLHAHFAVETLGRFVNDDQKQELAKAYYDPHAAYRDMDDYSWQVTVAPTPFVGNAPIPGLRHNTSINSLQMRSGREVQIPKPEKVYRIFLSGGSTA